MTARQEVNLYLPEFRRQRDVFSAEHMVKVIGGVVVVFVLVQLGQWWGMLDLRQNLSSAQQQQQQLEQTLLQLRRRQPRSQELSVERQVADLRRQLQRGRQISRIIVGQTLGNTQGFSRHMRSMARQSLSAISLTQFRLLNGGEYVEFDGWTRRATAVPHYLQKLRSEKSFEAVRFGVLSMITDDSKAGLLRFSLGKLPLDEKSKDAS